MTFRTQFEPQPAPFSIDYATPSVWLGSCFAQNMGQKLMERRLPACVNPTGIVFNPISLAESLAMITQNYQLSETEDVFLDGDLWHSFRLHGQFSNTEKAAILGGGQKSIEDAHLFWQNTQRLVLTLGTAWVFVHRQTGRVVANCHRVKAAEFERRRLSVDECLAVLVPQITQILATKPDLKIVISVSPVRHLSDGLAENTRSKSTLILLADALERQFPDSVYYFPAYEIVLDDLRDYRFFGQDMAHPTDMAVDYVFDQFQKTFFTTQTRSIMREVEAIVAMQNHRPRNPESVQHAHFLANLQQKMDTLVQKYPVLKERL